MNSLLLYVVLCLHILIGGYMAKFLRLENPESGVWYDLGTFGMGGVVEVMGNVTGKLPVLNLILSNSEDEVLNISSDLLSTSVRSAVLGYQESSKVHNLSNLKTFLLTVQIQSKMVYVNIKQDDGGVFLPYPKDMWDKPGQGPWDIVSRIQKVFVFGDDLLLTNLNAYVLV